MIGLSLIHKRTYTTVTLFGYRLWIMDEFLDCLKKNVQFVQPPLPPLSRKTVGVSQQGAAAEQRY